VKVSDLFGEICFNPASGAGGLGEELTVELNTYTLYLSPETGGTITEIGDIFALMRKLANGSYMQVVEFGDNPVFLGSTRTEFKITDPGTFRVEKVLATTEAVGVYKVSGREIA